MRFVSWNVNGLRACMQKGFMDFFTSVNADFFCLQETKLQAGQIALDLPGYEQYWNYAEKKGYSGTAIFTKHTPLSVSYGMGIPELDTEGRLITLEYPEFYLVTCYTPNAQRGLARIEHRLKWEAAFRDYLKALDSKKPVILCGDLNVAHNEIDLKNPNSNRGNAGFSDEERAAFSKLLECGFTDTFRHLHPDTTGAYTWWSYMFNARQNNAGWRIDYFVVSERIKEQIFSTPIYSEILGSDHCPVGLDIDIPCNGGIWPSFENTEKAETKTEIPETKSSGIKAAAIVLCAALLFTSICFIFPKGTHSPFVPDAQSTTAPVIRPPGDNLILCNVATEEVHYGVNKPSYSSQLRVDSFHYENKIYTIEPTYVRGSENFWIRIDAIDEAAHNGCKLIATVIDKAHLNSNHTELPSTWDVVTYRDEQGNFGGWFVFGSIRRDSYVRIVLTDGENTLQTLTLTVSPLLSEQIAEIWSTKNLADFAIHLEIMEFVLMNQDQEGRQSHFMALWENYPALLELTFREDACYWIEEHVKQNPNCAETANALSLLIADISFAFSEYRDQPITSIMDTGKLISHLAEQENLMECVDKLENEHIAYGVLRALQPAIDELEERGDASIVLLHNYGKSPLLGFLLSQPEFLSRLTIFQATEYIEKISEGKGLEAVSTEDLVMVITMLDDVRKSLLYAYPYTYEQLLLHFPAMQELETRDGAAYIMLGCVIAPQYLTEQRAVTAKALLMTDYYYEKLTDVEKQLLESGPIVYADLSTLPLGSPESEP